MRFLWRSYLGYVASVLLATVAATVLVSRGLETDALDELERELRARASLLATMSRPALAGAPAAPLEAELAQLGRELRTRFTVIRADGKVLADSHERAASMSDHANRPEVLDARRTGAGRVTRHSATVGDDMMYVAVRVGAADGTPLGFARVAFSLEVVRSRVAQLRIIVVLGALLATLLALLPGFLIARRLAAPLRDMTEAARAFGRGDYAPRVPGRFAADELGELARSFEAMAAALRERMQSTTREKDELAAVLASMVEGVVAIDAEERVVHMNEVAARTLGATTGDAIGRRIWEVTRVREVCELLRRTLEQPAPRLLDVVLPAQPRDEVLELHASPLRDARGAPSGAVVVLHDISELRRLETHRREFVANVSHELKTPLTAIVGLVETLREDAAMDEATRGRFLEKIERQAERLATLVRDLLTLSRVESDGGSLERVPLDLRAPAQASLRGLAASAEQKGITLEAALPDEPVMIDGDHETLRQAIDNLLDNAVKYTPKGGRVWLRLRAEGARVVVEVQDTGIGIEPRDQARVFERFYRVDKARSRELGGTGLGLSIVKHVTLAHGGEVSVESALEQGSTFRLSLPRRAEGAPP